MMFFNKGKFEKTIINSLKYQKFWNIVEVLKHQKKRNREYLIIIIINKREYKK